MSRAAVQVWVQKGVLIAGLLIGVVHEAVCQEKATAQDPLVPSPSIFDFTQGEGWGVALGASVEGENAYDGSDEYEIGVEPAWAVQYRLDNAIFFWEGTELGVKGLATDRLLLQGGARYEAGLESGDSEDGRLDGIEERDAHIVAFIEARYAFDEDWKNWVAARTLVGESDFGVLGVVAAGHRFGTARDGSGAELYAFSTFGNSEFINKDFGVPASDAQTSGLAETDLNGGYRSSGIQGVYRHIFNEHFQLIGSVGAEIYSAAIANSPLARSDYETEVALTALYIF